MDYNEELEQISNQIRRGEAVSFYEAFAAIEYQKMRQQQARSQAVSPWRAWFRKVWHAITNRERT